MSGIIVDEVRKGFYLDSVALMRFSRTIAGLDGVEEAALMMGTPANRQIMTDAGLLDAAGRAAEGGDLVIGIRAKDRDSAERALAESRALLDQPTAKHGGGEAWRPRTLRAADVPVRAGTPGRARRRRSSASPGDRPTRCG